MPVNSSLRSRQYCFTINNDTFEDLDSLLDLSFTYLIFGFEEGQDTGTSHIQGFVQFPYQYSFTKLKNQLQRAHIESCRGSAKQNRNYCMKDGEFYEFGDLPYSCLPEKDRQSLFKQFVSMVLSGKNSNHEIKEKYPNYWFIYKSKIKEMNEYIPNMAADRRLYIIPEEQKFAIKDAVIDEPVENYKGDRILVIPAYSDFNILHWINNHPQRVKRGYEIIEVDPEEVWVYYKDKVEKQYLINRYGDYIDGVDLKDILKGDKACNLMYQAGQEYDTPNIQDDSIFTEESSITKSLHISYKPSTYKRKLSSQDYKKFMDSLISSPYAHQQQMIKHKYITQAEINDYITNK